MEIRDQLNRQIQLKEPPKRIISLVPSQTELLVDLGLEEALVGITHYCVHPSYLKNIKTSVGGTKKVNLRKVKEFQPDLILCNKEENTREMVKALEDIAPVHVSDVSGLKDACRLITDYGVMFNREALANTMVTAIRRKLKSLRILAESSPERKVAYFIWNKPLMVAGKATFIDEMLKINKFQNIFTEARYPKVDVEDLKNKEIDICLLSSEPFPFKEEHKVEFEEFASEVKIVDGEFFSWYGSRLLKAIEYFKSFHS